MSCRKRRVITSTWISRFVSILVLECFFSEAAVSLSSRLKVSLHFNATSATCQDGTVVTYLTYNGPSTRDTYTLYPRSANLSSLQNDDCYRPRGSKVFATPLRSVAVKGTTSLALFDALGELETVKAYIPPEASQEQGLDVATSPCLQRLLEHVTIKNHNFKEHHPSDYDAFFVGAFDSPARYGNNSVVIGAIQDPGLLHRSEWIKFVAAFVGKENVAEEIFDSHKTRYECVKKGFSDEKHKKIAWFDEFLGTFYATSAKYLHMLFEDARGFYTPNCTGEFNLCSAQNLEAALQQADAVVTTGSNRLADFVNTLISNGIAQQTAMSFPSVQTSNVYNVDKLQGTEGGLDWFEGALVEPDVILLDLVTILHPEKVKSCQRLRSYKPTFFRNIANENATILTSNLCTNTSSQRVPVGGTLQLCECFQSSITATAPTGATITAIVTATVKNSTSGGISNLQLCKHITLLLLLLEMSLFC